MSNKVKVADTIWSEPLYSIDELTVDKLERLIKKLQLLKDDVISVQYDDEDDGKSLWIYRYRDETDQEQEQRVEQEEKWRREWKEKEDSRIQFISGKELRELREKADKYDQLNKETDDTK